MIVLFDKERYITGWFLSPDLFLIRPATNPKHILSNILFERAKNGVQVRIILYNNIFKLTSFVYPLLSFPCILLFSLVLSLLTSFANLSSFLPRQYSFIYYTHRIDCSQ